MPEILTDEMAALLWSDQLTPDIVKTTSNDSRSAPDSDDDKEPVVDDEPDKEGAEPDKITAAMSDAEPDGPAPDAPPDAQPDKKGRKPAELVALVNQMIKEEELAPFEGEEEVKTVEEAKELLKLNFKRNRDEGEEEGWKEKVKAYSPQIQAILHYADQGAQSANQLLQLMGAMKDMEDVYELDNTTPEGRLEVVRQYYKAKGVKDTMAEKQVTMLKDAGEAAVKEASDEFYPELMELNQKRVEQKIRQAESDKSQAEESSKKYLGTVRGALDKDKLGEIKLGKDEKARIYDAVANPKYRTISGMPTTQFVKTLEELQFGEKDKQNYEHFLNIVQFTIDPKGFIEKLKTSLSTDISADTQRTLRATKKGSPTTDYEPNSKETGKKVVKRDFVNPFK